MRYRDEKIDRKAFKRTQYYRGFWHADHLRFFLIEIIRD